jgi:leader peptidase (prepilin peptidase)/N-methyltransferase
VAAFLLLVGVLGLLVGSFLDRVIHRVPAGEPVFPAPRSAVPLRHSLVQLLTGAAFVAVAWRAVQLDQRAAVPALLVFTALGIALSAIDLAVRRLPDRLVLPAYPVLAVLLAGAGAVRHDWTSVLRAGLGALTLFGFFFVLAATSPKGMGFGDVKLAGVIGLVLGYLSWSALLIGAFAAFALGAGAAVVVLASGAGNRRTALPFGPFMVAGALLALWVTPALLPGSG